MKRLLGFSGGKDSTALMCWAKENYSKSEFEELELDFCDTSWEDEITYKYIDYVGKHFNKKITVLKSEKYDGFIDLVHKKGRFPATKARFCTEELKVKPLIDHILTHNCDLTILQGIRKQESKARSRMGEVDEYFRYYKEPYGHDKKGKPKYHTYRRKEVLKYISKFKVIAYRPLIDWTHDQVFQIMKRHKVDYNPLYAMGMKRVGCFPCIMEGAKTIARIAEIRPEKIKMISEVEKESDSTFLAKDDIPPRFCNKHTGKGRAPFIEDVVKYGQVDPDQMELFPQSEISCASYYNICE